jgi:hypothetical protein
MKFRKKPVVIDAMQYNGRNQDAIREFVGRPLHCDNTNALHISTLEGLMEARVDDWIIRGVKGEFYPCKPDIFSVTYEEVPVGMQTTPA